MLARLAFSAQSASQCLGGRRLGWFIAAAMCFLVAESLFAVDEPLRDARVLEERVVAARRQIRTVQLTLSIRSAARKQGETELLDPRGPFGVERRMRVWQDGEKLRFDHTNFHVKTIAPDGTVKRSTRPDGAQVEAAVLTPDGYIFGMLNEFENSAPVAARVGPRGASPAVELKAWDIRFLGLTPMPAGLLHSTKTASFYATQDRVRQELTAEMVDGAELQVSRYERPDAKQVALWIDPARNYSLVRADFSMTMKDGKRRVQSIRARPKRYGEAIWFPEQVEYTCFVEDQKTEHELWTITDAVVDAPIDPRVFTVEGLSLPPKTYVAGLPEEVAPSGSMIWDGKKLVDTPYTQQQREQAQAKKEFKESRRSSWLVWAIIVNAVGAIILLGLYWRHRRVSRP